MPTPGQSSNPGDTSVELSNPLESILNRKKGHYLVVVQGLHPGKYYQLEKRVIGIGRKEDNDIILADHRVSGHHCRLSFAANMAVAEDLGSTNGTFVDEERVEGKAVLHIGSTLLIGRTLMRLQYRSEEELRRDEQLYVAATTDQLTGVPNRFTFLARAVEELSYARRNRTPVSTILIDADFFKNINDTHGHLAGDEVLKLLGQILAQEKRHEDLLARYGGEEFIMLLRNTALPQAVAFAERLRVRIQETEVHFEEAEIRVTISAGVHCQVIEEETQLEDLIHKADGALYKAKETGRNRVCVQAPDLDQEKTASFKVPDIEPDPPKPFPDSDTTIKPV